MRAAACVYRLLERRCERSALLLAIDWGMTRANINTHFALNATNTDLLFSAVIDRRALCLTRLKETACMEYIIELGLEMEVPGADGSPAITVCAREVAQALHNSLQSAKTRKQAAFMLSEEADAMQKSIALAFHNVANANTVRNASSL